MIDVVELARSKGQPTAEAGFYVGTNETSYGFPAGGAIRRINSVQPPIE